MSFFQFPSNRHAVTTVTLEQFLRNSALRQKFKDDIISKAVNYGHSNSNGDC